MLPPALSQQVLWCLQFPCLWSPLSPSGKDGRVSALHSFPARNDQEDQVTKSDFIDAVAAKSGFSKKDAGTALEAVLDSVK